MLSKPHAESSLDTDIKNGMNNKFSHKNYGEIESSTQWKITLGVEKSL